MRALLAIGSTAALVTGCATVATSPPPPPAGAAWTLQASATSGASLVLGDPLRATLRLACRRNPGDLLLTSDVWPAARGQVTLALGRHEFELAPEAGVPTLAASGPVPDALPAAIMSGAPLRVAAPNIRPVELPAPPQDTAAAFAIACGRSAAG